MEVVNGEIKEMETNGVTMGSPERSLSQSSSNAVPSINPSAKDILREKVKLKEQIETGLQTLQNRERKEQQRNGILSLSLGASSMSNLAAAASTDKSDPYAPTSTSTFLG